MELYQNTLIKLIVRQGSDLDRKKIVLNSGELGFTTDTHRLFVGTGNLSGGVLVGNKFKGKVADITNLAPSEIGDMGYSTDSGKLMYVKTGDGSFTSDWDTLAVGYYTSGDQYINISNSNEITLKSLSAGKISPDIIKNSTGNPLSMDFDGRMEVKVQSPLFVDGNTIKISLPNIYDNIYPIGSVYFSVDFVNPSTKFGGTWEQIAKGKFIAGVGQGWDVNNSTRTFSVSNNNGEYEHTLSIAELPPHSHPVKFKISNENNNDFFPNNWIPTDDTTDRWGVIGNRDDLPVQTVTTSNRLSATHTGGGNPHNNTPPAFGLYVWKRIS